MPHSKPAYSRAPEKHKTALVTATLDLIAENGLKDTTVSRIIERAGLSRGMIHLHFGGKDALMTAAAEAQCKIYYDEMDRLVADAEGQPAQTVLAVIRADLSEEVLNEKSVKIWHAFRGVAHSNPGIARYSDTRDKRMRALLKTAFEEMATSSTNGSDRLNASDATFGTLALLEGMWTDFLTHPDEFSRNAALRIITRFLAALFPEHFEPVDPR